MSDSALGFASALRDGGVGGLRFDNQIKCLHAQLAHFLAGGSNPIGARVWRLLEQQQHEQQAEAEEHVDGAAPPREKEVVEEETAPGASRSEAERS